MNLKYLLGILLTAFLLFSNEASPGLIAQTPTDSRLTLLSATAQEVVVELTVTDFEVETVELAGQTYQRLLIPGTGQTDTTGAPQLPVRATLVGLPTTAGVSIQLLEADSELLAGYRLAPAPELIVTGDTPFEQTWQEKFTLDEALYATDAFYPHRPVALGHTGLMRDQAVAQVQLYPLQINPVTGELRLYRRLVARITWDTSTAAAASPAEQASPAYEKLLRRTLLNYEALARPAMGQSPPSEPAEAEVGTADSSPALKIGVTEDGLYELSYGDLTGAGFDLNGVNPQTLKLTHRTTELPIYISGEADGVFDPSDTLLFYGTAIKNDKYTNKNIYWLTAGAGNGQRMSPRSGSGSGGDTATHSPAALHLEENTEYWLNMPNGDDHFFWGSRLTAPDSVTHAFTVSNISTDTNLSATVRVTLMGRTNTDHHTKIYLNNVAIDDQVWSGKNPFTHAATISQTSLIEGQNFIKVEGVDTGAAADQFYLNWIELDYWDTYVAENDSLYFGPPRAGTFQFEVTNFSSSQIDVFDVTNPANVGLITDTTIAADGGSYKLQFKDTAQAETRYLALTPAQRKSPATLKLDQASSWRSPNQKADYIIITHQNFYNSILPLANHRSAQGLQVVTVKVEDIYDEFNAGIFNPQAIRDFLTYAYNNWQPPAPTYVLLVGDAFYDYKNDLPDHTGTINYVPTQLVKTDLLAEAPSDNWFVTISGSDNIPDMFIGRFGAQTSSQIDHMVAKIIQYEQTPPASPWNKQALLVADDGSASFEAISEQLAGLLPADYTANKVYADDYADNDPPGEDPTVDITQHINTGSLLVNYSGHGNLNIWGSWSGGRIFDNDDIVALNNTNKLPVVTVANCLNGYFAWQETGGLTSVAEQFLRLEDKGAVAVWAATGLGYASGHQALMAEFYEIIFQDGEHNLGAATTAAKVAISGQNLTWDELIDTFVLIGDPAMQIGVPASGGAGAFSTYLPIVVKEE